GRARLLGQKNYSRTEFVSWATRTVWSNHHIATGGEHLCEGKNCASSEARARTANHLVAKALSGVGKQIAVVAGTDQSGTMTVREKASQNNGKDQQSIVPKRTDVIFRYRSPDDPRPVVDFITQRARPKLQQPKSKRDQRSRKQTFDLQFFWLLAEPLLKRQIGRAHV